MYFILLVYIDILQCELKLEYIKMKQQITRQNTQIPKHKK